MDIIKRLETHRLKNKISQQTLAAKLDISFSTVNRWLNGSFTKEINYFPVSIERYIKDVQV